MKPNMINKDPGFRKGASEYALFVGRMSPEKGIQTMFEAWAEVGGIPLKVSGDGPLTNQMREYVRNRGLEKIDFLGWRSRTEVIDLMQGARFLVFPSEWYEGFPLTIAEAFACGLPVITSKLGAMAEIVDDGRTGLHFTPGNAEDLTAKVQWAWTHQEQIEAMGMEARREYEQKYTAEKNYAKLIEIYQRAIRARH